MRQRSRKRREKSRKRFRTRHSRQVSAILGWQRLAVASGLPLAVSSLWIEMMPRFHGIIVRLYRQNNRNEEDGIVQHDFSALGTPGVCCAFQLQCLSLTSSTSITDTTESLILASIFIL